MYPDVQLFIDGAWTPSAGGKTLDVLNPATGENLGGWRMRSFRTSTARWRRRSAASVPGARCRPMSAAR